VFGNIHLRLRAGVRYIVLYMVLYSLVLQAVSGLYNERSPLDWVCGVCQIFYNYLGLFREWFRASII
jgi:hypothetical protein